MKKNNSIRSKIKSAPFGIQVVLLMSALITVLLTITLFRSYQMDRKLLISEEYTCSGKVLALEMNSLDDYISELTAFSLQPCYDPKFMKGMTQDAPLNEEELTYILDKMSDYYYTRSDISSYCIYFLNQDIRVGRQLREQVFTITDNIPNLNDMAALSSCEDSKSGIAIVPSENKGLLFTFYRAIRPAGKDSVAALVRSDVDYRDIRTVLSVQLHPDEYRVLLTPNGKILYSELSEKSNEAFSEKLAELLEHDSSSNRFHEITLEGDRYLTSMNSDSKYGLSLITLIPYDNIVAPLKRLLVQTLFWGVILWFCFISTTYLLTSYVTKPFKLFAKEIDSIGNGNLNTEMSVEGCLEINQLRDSFQDMGLRIQTLMRQNYIARMEEQNARLSSEGSHIDPLLLYASLRSMSEGTPPGTREELMDLSSQIASLIRYAMKGGNFVTIHEEIRHAEYFAKMLGIQLGTTFPFEIQSDPSIDQLLIPKLTLMNMMEYLVPKQYVYEDEIPQIQIEITRNEDRLLVRIHNLSQVSTPEEQILLKSQLSDCEVPGNIPQNVLCSLYARLLILCEKDITILVSSGSEEHTTIAIDIPIKRE